MKKSPMQLVAEAFKGIAYAVRVFQVGGRRVQRFHAEQRWRWVETSDGLNRHERRRYLAQMRSAKWPTSQAGKQV